MGKGCSADAPSAQTVTPEPVKPVERYPTIGATPGEAPERHLLAFRPGEVCTAEAA